MNTAIYQGNVMQPGQFNNYNIAGNINNAFALGEVGSVDDFFLVGLEPEDESIYPSLTGNILDSEGNLLFQLRNNVIKLNPGNCSKIVGNLVGYEIHDSAGNLIFKVETVFAQLPQINNETFVTTIKANFYNKNKELVFKATSGEPDEMITANTKTAFGYSNGGFALVNGLNEEELNFLSFVFGTKNATVELVRGIIEGQDIDLNGKVLMNATIRNCQVVVSGGEFAFIGIPTFQSCNIKFTESAHNIVQLFEALQNQSNPQ